MTAELRSIYSGPIRRAAERLTAAVNATSALIYTDANGKSRMWDDPWGIQLLRRTDTGLVHNGGGQLALPASTVQGATNAEAFDFLTGRRYRISYFCRAWNGGGAAAYMTFLPYVDGVSKHLSMGDVWTSLDTGMPYTSVTATWFVDVGPVAVGADQVPAGNHTFQVVANTGPVPVTYTLYTLGSHFYIEDCGPIV